VILAGEEIGDDLCRRAERVLAAHTGLRFHDGNRDTLIAGLARAASAERVEAAELIARIERSPTEDALQALVRGVTIGETYFFRHPEHFAALREVILPDLAARGRPLKAWSAGCATGEEAYSIALAMGSGASVLGTDINKASLETARRAHYGRWSLRGEAAPAGLVSVGGDAFEVTAAVRAGVRFEYLNLHGAPYPQGFDVVFCRNVLVYFSTEAAAAVMERLEAALADGGWLVMTALDVAAARHGLAAVYYNEVTLLRKTRAVPNTTPATGTPTIARAEQDWIGGARRAADQGQHERAVRLAREAVARARTPQALHLLALVVGERGDRDEARALLREAVQRDPDYVLGRLGLGLDGDDGELRAVLALLADRRDDEILPGPEPLAVSWVRTMAQAGLKRGNK
jgi:chemotaxis protein methyltransferase CheR